MLAVAVAACGGGAAFDDLRSEIERSRLLWSTVEPDSYEYVLERICFCGEEARGPVRVRVENGSIDELRYTMPDLPVDSSLWSLFPDVDGLFDLLENALDRDAAQIDAIFDPDWGIPVDLFIDYSREIADEEVGFVVRELPSL